jgi:hypothetical protein
VKETNGVDVPLDVSDIDGGDANLIKVTIGLDDFPLNSTGNDFVDERGRQIKGVVLEDVNDDDTGDIPINGVLISLVSGSGIVLATTTTDSSGSFAFVRVAPGLYTLIETNKLGFSDVLDSDGDDPNSIFVDVKFIDALENVFVDEVTVKPSISPFSQPSLMPVLQPVSTQFPFLGPVLQGDPAPFQQPIALPSAQPISVPIRDPTIPPVPKPIPVPFAQSLPSLIT